MPRSTLLHRWLLALCCGLAGTAQAQLHLPQLPRLPSLPSVVEQPLRRTLPPALSPTDLLNQRRTLIDQLLHREPRALERDPAGEPIVRGEVLLSSPSVALLDAAQAAGFRVLREQRLEPIGLYLVTLQAPAGLDTAGALAALRRIEPEAAQDFNHVYLPAGQLDATPAAATPPASAPASTAARMGLIDGGVAPDHPSLRQARLQVHGCGGERIADRHGTAVASLLVGRDGRFRGALPGASLYAADIYCGSAAHGTVEAIVEALSWMAQQQVPVVNLSVVGPPNRLLERAVGALSARGHLLVAAVGNDGPAAPPLYPAAYATRFAGVVGVTAVDARRLALLEAGQGEHVMLAAPGAEVAAADSEGRGYGAARGTSFAAPLVAGLLAAHLAAPDPQAARRAIDVVARQAIDLGAPGRDSVYGFGLVGEDLRIDPRRVGAPR